MPEKERLGPGLGQSIASNIIEFLGGDTRTDSPGDAVMHQSDCLACLSHQTYFTFVLYRDSHNCLSLSLTGRALDRSEDVGLHLVN